MTKTKSLAGLDQREIVRGLLRNVNIDPGSGCWLWQKSLNTDGYGRMVIEGKEYKVHRLSAWVFLGMQDDDLQALHECDNPACANLQHLFLGTHQDNMRDRDAKGRTGERMGESNPRAIVTEAIVKEMRKRRKQGETGKALALDYGISSSHVYEICTYRKWKHVT